MRSFVTASSPVAQLLGHLTAASPQPPAAHRTAAQRKGHSALGAGRILRAGLTGRQAAAAAHSPPSPVLLLLLLHRVLECELQSLDPELHELHAFSRNLARDRHTRRGRT